MVLPHRFAYDIATPLAYSYSLLPYSVFFCPGREMLQNWV